MSDKGPLEELLKAWKAPSPRANFEVNVLRRLRSQPVRESFWQRWFVEPWQVWRRELIDAWTVSALAIALGLGVFNLVNESSIQHYKPINASLGLNSFATFPEGSVTSAYLELTKR